MFVSKLYFERLAEPFACKAERAEEHHGPKHTVRPLDRVAGFDDLEMRARRSVRPYFPWNSATRKSVFQVSALRVLNWSYKAEKMIPRPSVQPKNCVKVQIVLSSMWCQHQRGGRPSALHRKTKAKPIQGHSASDGMRLPSCVEPESVRMETVGMLSADSRTWCKWDGRGLAQGLFCSN